MIGATHDWAQYILYSRYVLSCTVLHCIVPVLVVGANKVRSTVMGFSTVPSARDPLSSKNNDTKYVTSDREKYTGLGTSSVRP